MEMKIIFKFFGLGALFLLLSIVSCQNNAQQTSSDEHKSPLDQRYEEVVAQHDEVMPKITDMELLQEKLRKRLKTLTETDSTEKEEVLGLLSLLKKGHDGMFDWMNNFKNKHLNAKFYEESSEEELKAYLDEEERKIVAVGKTMLKGIEDAEKYLNNLKSE